MYDSFIARDIPFLEQNKLQSDMSEYVDQINQINGYYKQQNYNHRISKKQIQKSEFLNPKFKVLDKKFEDHFKEIEDKTIKEWMEKMSFEEKYNSQNTVPFDFIMKFLKQMTDNFNNMIQFQQMPKENLKENKQRMSCFEKDFMMRQIQDSKVTITMFTTLIQQVRRVIDCEEIVDNDNKEFIESLLEKYLQIIQVSSQEIVEKSQTLLAEDQNNVLTKNVKNTLLQRLLEIEQIFIAHDNNKHNTNYAYNIKKIYQLNSSPSQSQKDDTYKISQNLSQPLKTGQSSQHQYRRDIDLSVSSHKETEYLDCVLKEYGANQDNDNEVVDKFQFLMRRLKQMDSIIKIDQTHKIHEMVDLVNEFKTVLFLYNLAVKNQIEKHLKAEQNMNLYERKELTKKIEEYRLIIQQCFKKLEENKKASLNVEKPSFKRYLGDQGMITHRHFILNKDNLLPIFKHLDPSRFEGDQTHKKIDMNTKQEEQMRKHIQRIQQSNQSQFSLYSSPTSSNIKSRKNTLRSGDMSFLSKIKSRQNSLWSKYDDTQGNLSCINNKALQSSIVEENNNNNNSNYNNFKNMSDSKCVIERKKNIITPGQGVKDRDKSKGVANFIKQNTTSNTKKKGLKEYEYQKNSKVIQQNITQLINNSFDEDKVNQSILERDSEYKQILQSTNKLPHILLSLRNTQNSHQFNFTKSDLNSMAENSQENLTSSFNDLSIAELSPNSNFQQQNYSIFIDQGKQISPLKPNKRIRGLNYDKLKHINNFSHQKSGQTRCSSVEMGGHSVELYSIKNTQPMIGNCYYAPTNSNKNESFDDNQESSILFSSQMLKNMSPQYSLEQSIDFSMKSDFKQFTNQTQYTTQVDDIMSRRQKQRLNINRMKLPSTLPIMNSIKEQQQLQQQQKLVQQQQQQIIEIQNQKKRINKLETRNQDQNRSIEIEVQEFTIPEERLKAETVNLYDTMYIYKMKVEQQEEEKQAKLNKRQKIIDTVNASFMPKYIHLSGGKIASKTNPKIIRNLLTTFKKEDLEKKQYVLNNYKKLKKRDESDYYGIQELTVPPKEHQFITSTLCNTYDDIKTGYILEKKKND